VWIITGGERAAFQSLDSDRERDYFVEAFWARRDRTPDTFENEFKEEHYRRIVYANDHFRGRAPGWGTDRGHLYIEVGPPDDIEHHPLGSPAEGKHQKDDDSTLPPEVWRYRYIDGVGQDIVIRFVDVCGCGDYQLSAPSALKDALFQVHEIVMRKRDGGGDREGIQLYIVGNNPPKIRFKNLEEKAIVNLPWKQLPFDVETDNVKATDATSVVSVTIKFQKRDIVFAEKSQHPQATLNIFGRVTTLTEYVAEIFENALLVDPPSAPESDANATTSDVVATLALRNGRYRVEIAVQEAGTDRWGRWAGDVKVGD